MYLEWNKQSAIELHKFREPYYLLTNEKKKSEKYDMRMMKIEWIDDGFLLVVGRFGAMRTLLFVYFDLDAVQKSKLFFRDFF